IAGTESLSDRLESLLRQNEQQRMFLNDVVGALERKGLSLSELGVSFPSGVLGNEGAGFGGVVNGSLPRTASGGDYPSLDRTNSASSTSSHTCSDSLRGENESLKAEVLRLQREMDIMKAGGRDGGQGRPEAPLAGAAVAIAHGELQG
ncbi:hypothetical protein HK097_009203, partial [Rhizophlyctis rosea]